jgi:hypothetical protein
VAPVEQKPDQVAAAHPRVTFNAVARPCSSVTPRPRIVASPRSLAIRISMDPTTSWSDEANIATAETGMSRTA